MNDTIEFRNPQLLIGGEWRTGNGTSFQDVFDPATNARIAELAYASEQDVDDAVAAAAQAFPGWSSQSLSRRVQQLQRVRALLVERSESLALTISIDQGKLLDEARGEVVRVIEALDCALAAPMLYHSASGNIAGGLDARRVRIPLGVCAAITPFNFPAMNPAQFASWALVTGNTLVLKASEQDPLASTHVISLFHEAGLPDGVLNLIHGGVDAAKRLVAHPDVRAVSCITSSATAKAVYVAATSQGKRAQANGGAKNPIIVAADADLDAAADGVVSSAFGMAGQRCLAGSRVIAVDEVYEDLAQRIVKLASSLVLGGGRDPRATMGPLVSAQSKARVEQLLEAAEQEGATFLLDGRQAEPIGEDTGSGYFLGATVIADAATGSVIDREEVFGPVVTLHRAPDAAAAVELANATEFGNASTIYTQSGSTARAFEQASQAGNIGVNSFPAPPFNFTMGGLRSSFYGDLHVLGDGPLDFYTDHKLVVSRW